ncbi:hypothetical protein [Caloramator sp. ALD01]|uniref:hypothetical protein n=1 Tax=Caloramator sp. ALD01 TaxID=1031288 RepID=UPI0003F93ADA|nr:hypothetical protein [Caloramator sp. ALD01]
MEMLILEKNDEYIDMFYKLHEEVDELSCELIKHVTEKEETKLKIAEETLDVIQVCIGILDKLEKEGIEIAKEVEKHNMKLLKRGWRYKSVVYLTRV